GGGPGYYGVRLESIAADGSALDLVVTFRAGSRYCCCEPGCHVPFHSERGWAWLRHCMDCNGLENQPLPVIRKFKGIIEPGALFDSQPGSGTDPQPQPVDAFEYEAGPYSPVPPYLSVQDTED